MLSIFSRNSSVSKTRMSTLVLLPVKETRTFVSKQVSIAIWHLFLVLELAEIFPIDLKLDYKPRRVDYRALREGRTIELMNFFHFDGAEMTLRHITLAGVRWSK
jgi:hypothetical protein